MHIRKNWPLADSDTRVPAQIFDAAITDCIRFVAVTILRKPASEMMFPWCAFGLVAAFWNLDEVNGFIIERTTIGGNYGSGVQFRDSRKPHRWATPSRRFYTGSTSPEEAMKRTSSHLKKLNKLSKQRQRYRERQLETAGTTTDRADQEEFDIVYQEYLSQPANSLKEQLQERRLSSKGRKPDLARRLAEYNLKLNGLPATDGRASTPEPIEPWLNDKVSFGEGEDSGVFSAMFCGLPLSSAATRALKKAEFLDTPSPIQAAAIPRISAVHDEQAHPESFILHAETGSGKTLAYLLPITEHLWKQQEEGGDEFGIILTPTRELAAQVAGIASVLAPPGLVRLVSHPTNLLSDMTKDRGEQQYGGRLVDESIGRNTVPKLFVGSAKSILYSLYGDGGDRFPASPTPKPVAMTLLQKTRWLVLDEVDRLLNIAGKKTNRSSQHHQHEKPAAIIASSAVRLSVGRAQVIAVSATVGRPLKRELTRVLGLSTNECPEVIRGDDTSMSTELQGDDFNQYNHRRNSSDEGGGSGVHVGRAVTIPSTVTNYVTPVDTSSVGKLMTSAFDVIKSLNSSRNNGSLRMLLVLTRGCGLKTQTAIGALKHFQCQPEPISLLDALDTIDGGTDHLIERHRRVSGATGIGESGGTSYFDSHKNQGNDTESIHDDESSDNGYLLVTGEDTIRGLHLDGLDVVIVVGRAHGPDEYTHIAGRTGRAGKQGTVVNVLSEEHVAAVKGWEKMLDVKFEQVGLEDIKSLL